MLNCSLVYTLITVDWQNDGMKNNKSIVWIFVSRQKVAGIYQQKQGQFTLP
jgi:hypothetical protein